MSDLPDPPAYMAIENIPDAVGKFRGIGGTLMLGDENITANSDTNSAGDSLSNALRDLEPDLF